MKNKIILLSILIAIFIVITFLVITKNSFVINLDDIVRNFMVNNYSPVITKFMLSITKLGNIYETLVILIVFGLFLIKKNRKYFYIFTIDTFLAISLTEIFKVLIHKSRPDFIFLKEIGFSFPSYHATISTIFILSSIYLLAPYIKNIISKNIFIITISIIFTLVAFSRIYLSVHWLSDVIAGIILGSICFIFSEIVCCHKKENVL